MTIQKIGAILAVLLPLIGGVWWLSGEVSTAQGVAKKQETLVEAVKVLTAIHKSQATKAQAEAALLAKLCAGGKLKGADCVASVAAAPPTP
jgi:hypothetical protein